jgi:polyisoprenoid-binding protein YceI
MNMATQRWTIDPTHSTIDFVVRHLVVSKVRGTFTRYTGSIELDSDPSKSSASAKIEVASLDTRDEKRDAHVKSPDFFDAEKYPEITFTSSKIVDTTPTGTGKLGTHGVLVDSYEGSTVDTTYQVVGALTLHGVTRDVTLNVESLGQTPDPWGNQRVAFSAKTSINRKDFGMTWSQALEAGGLLVGEKVDIELEIQATKAA